MTNRTFAVVAFAIALAIAGASQLIPNDYYFSAAYTVLQFSHASPYWSLAPQFGHSPLI